jgi:hypothetical protein
MSTGGFLDIPSHVFSGSWFVGRRARGGGADISSLGEQVRFRDMPFHLALNPPFCRFSSHFPTSPPMIRSVGRNCGADGRTFAFFSFILFPIPLQGIYAPEKKTRTCYSSACSLWSAASSINAEGICRDGISFFFFFGRIAGPSVIHPRFIAVIQVRVCGSLCATALLIPKWQAPREGGYVTQLRAVLIQRPSSGKVKRENSACTRCAPCFCALSSYVLVISRRP